MSTDPLLENGSRWVAMALYLEDRREIKDALARIEGDVKAMRREMDRDDGQEVAEEAAEAAVVRARREKREILRDVGLCVLSAALALGGAVLLTLLA